MPSLPVERQPSRNHDRLPHFPSLLTFRVGAATSVKGATCRGISLHLRHKIEQRNTWSDHRGQTRQVKLHDQLSRASGPEVKLRNIPYHQCFQLNRSSRRKSTHGHGKGLDMHHRIIVLPREANELDIIPVSKLYNSKGTTTRISILEIQPCLPLKSVFYRWFVCFWSSSDSFHKGNGVATEAVFFLT